MKQMNQSHASEAQLALLAAGELSFFEKTRVRWHVGSCEHCRQELASFEEARAIAQNAGAELPDNLDWDRLSAEMSANIRLGVEAGECVRTVASPAASMDEEAVRRPQIEWNMADRWRTAFAVAAVVVVVYGGSWIALKQGSKHFGGNEPAAAQQITLDAEPDRLVIEHGKAKFQLVSASASTLADVSVGMDGSLRAQNIDEDGQVTIYHVYAQ